MSNVSQMPSKNAPPEGALHVVTFGCRLNTYESQVMKELGQTAGLTNSIIINTCAVTAEAERQAKQTIRRLRREHPDAEIIVTGCASQINPQSYANMSEVSRVIGNDEKMKLSSYHQDTNHDRVLVNDIMTVRETAGHLVSGFEGKARAFVQVQNGCDHRCTFCTIPYGRGNSRSVAISEIVAQVKSLVQSGYQEIVMTGVDITAYGADLPGSPTLGQMLLTRLRLQERPPVVPTPEVVQRRLPGTYRRLPSSRKYLDLSIVWRVCPWLLFCHCRSRPRPKQHEVCVRDQGQEAEQRGLEWPQWNLQEKL